MSTKTPIPSFGDKDPEIEKVVRAARYSVTKDSTGRGLSQKEIAEKMGVHASTVSRWLERAQKDGILKTDVVVPRWIDARQQLRSILEARGVRSVVVVPDGPDRNIENLGKVGAEELFETIKIVDNQKAAGQPIRIVLACGTTVLKIIEYLVVLIEEYFIKEDNSFKHPRFEIYPSTLYGDFQLRAPYPHMAVVFLTVLLALRNIPKAKLEINPFTPQLPDNFYRKNVEERKHILESFGLDSFIEGIRQSADIFVMGIGTTRTIEYDEIRRNMNEPAQDDKPAEILYIPVDEHGIESPKVARKIQGIRLGDLRNIMKDPKRHIIVAAGGKDKRQAILAVVRNPCYTTLITDFGAAQEAISDNRKALESLSTQGLEGEKQPEMTVVGQAC
jgi:DNA-binding transcriptional regulator LsrR (DeoR family)